MERSSGMLFAVLLYAFATVLRADEPPQAPDNRAVGTVYGKTVTAADIGLTAPIDVAVKFDSRDTAQWELMGRITTTFGRPVVDRFVKRQKIEATADEIEKFHATSRKMKQRNLEQWQAKRVQLKKDLAASDLAEADKAKLEKELAMYERFIAAQSKEPAGNVLDNLARRFIVAWKTERELHWAYGGRVIFQQAGLEALDARRRLFEEAEKNGDLKFEDPGVRHMFYYYSHMRHSFIDEKALDRPWFLEDPD